MGVTVVRAGSQVRAPLDCLPGEAGAADARAVLVDRAAKLDAAIEAARSANISVTRAKRLQKELQAQAAAAGASSVLGEAVAEAAAAALTACGQYSSLQVLDGRKPLACNSEVKGVCRMNYEISIYASRDTPPRLRSVYVPTTVRSQTSSLMNPTAQFLFCFCCRLP